MTRAIRIMDAVCKEFGITREDIRARNRIPHLVAARRKICHLARAEGMSLPAIGEMLDRHHTTVIDHLRRPVVRPQVKLKTPAAARDYTEEQIEVMTRRRLGNAWG